MEFEEGLIVKMPVCHGDISQLEFDALVTAANNWVWMAGGVKRALKRAGVRRLRMATLPMMIGLTP